MSIIENVSELPEKDSEENESYNDRLKIREKLSNMSFADIQKLKEELGSKFYNETVLGEKKRKHQVEYKRSNKNRPREVSSKIRFPKPEPNHTVVKNPKKIILRDPRFDSLCGEFDRKTFKSNYKFVNDIRKKEKKELEKELQNTSNVERKKQIKLLIQRIDNQIREEEKLEKVQNKEKEEKADIKNKLMKGEKPKFKKKSDKKIEDLVEKYEDLKKQNKLRKHIQKKHKKLAVKEQKRIKHTL